MSYHSKLQKYFWFLYKEHTIYEQQGIYSQVKVTKRGSRLSLYTGKKYLQSTINGKLTSTNSYFTWYLVAPWFSGKFKGNIESLLILGLGGGYQVKYYNQVYNVRKITGVEIDPVIVEIGKKYFDLNDSNLITITQDAYKFVETSSNFYDLIIVDLFKENKSENSRQSLTFLKTLKEKLFKDGVLFINKLNEDSSNKQLEIDLSKTFSCIYTLQIFNTKFFIATNSDSAPKSMIEIQKLLTSSSNFRPELKFFRSLRPKQIELSI